MASDVPIPDFEWYSRVSSAGSLPPRCPFASVERCPRYWQSLSLLGELGSTKLDAERDEELRRRWEHSEHWPPTAEYATAISGPTDQYGRWKAPLLSNFCPETIYDRFGYFASSMSRYADEIDTDNAHMLLRETRAPTSDPRWAWAHVRAMHYSECQYYSVLSAGLLKSSDDGAADVTLKIPFVADIRFKLRFRQPGERMKALAKRVRRAALAFRAKP